MHISQRAQRVQSSGIRRMFDLASRLENPIDLSIGQPHFDVPKPVRDAAIRAIEEGRNRYTLTQGLPELNEALLDRIEANSGYRPEASLLTVGAAGGLVLALMTLLDESDRILIPDPNFVCYKNLAALLTTEPSYYDIYPDFRITEERLEAGMTEGVRAIIVNTPSNPTGRVLEPEELATVARFARRHDVAVISDEIYDAFSFDGPCPSMVTHLKETILVGGFSKTFGIPGWRLGFVAGPRDVIERMRTLQQFTFVCAPSPAQHAGLVALTLDMTPYVDAYRKKRDRVIERLSPVYDIVRPGGAFYAFPRAPGGLTSSEFAERALSENLLVVPGTAFSRRDSHFRMSYAVEDSRLEEGLDLLVSLGERCAADAGTRSH